MSTDTDMSADGAALNTMIAGRARLCALVCTRVHSCTLVCFVGGCFVECRFAVYAVYAISSLDTGVSLRLKHGRRDVPELPGSRSRAKTALEDTLFGKTQDKIRHAEAR